ncbi:helix-turn-helix domain-containing protein [Nocardioides sp. KC13]|uniref:Helix-turn-helix domain-containing protein n=2 Tax=Nocardioides turkmenicus TaxID=2711220 RepID=A0A6M1QYR8_9ACTN|nr:helix-turn-helix domain-containing protein [Nocardioides sp. KC13]NGN92840.1 helix-turn-helix domain-containing protein [Nocardioides sp. KC13]
MDIEQHADLERRAKVHAALGDPVRLRIVDILHTNDASPTEIAGVLAVPSNLFAHHVHVLVSAGVVSRHHSEGDRRRTYLRLEQDMLDSLGTGLRRPAPKRVLFVCTGNTARSHLAAALWRQVSTIPADSAGTHPADRINPGTIDVATRRELDLPIVEPQRIEDVLDPDDLVVTVCDRAHETPKVPGELHWSIPDPVGKGPEAFDTAYAELERRIQALASRFEPDQSSLTRKE